MPNRKKLIDLLKQGMEELIDKMNSDEGVIATEVTRTETPDGPMHTFKKIRIRNGSEMEDVEDGQEDSMGNDL